MFTFDVIAAMSIMDSWVSWRKFHVHDVLVVTDLHTSDNSSWVAAFYVSVMVQHYVCFDLPVESSIVWDYFYAPLVHDGLVGSMSRP